MNHPTFPRTVEPLVERNPFRAQRYQLREIMPFQEARSLLPVPVLPQRPPWEEMYWRAWEIAWTHLRQPKLNTGLVANFIDSALNDNASMWHSAFMTQFGIYGRRAFDFLGTLENFYARQHQDGYICRSINTVEGYDVFHPFDPNGTGPNVLAWAEWRCFRHTGDEERLQRVFWPLMALHRWFRRHRTWPGGLYWATGLSSGMDNQPRVPQGQLYHNHWSWLDANLQASLNCLVLSHMAQWLEEAELAAELSEERSFLHREVNARMWNDDTRFYHDVDPAGHFSPLKSIGAYWALLDKEFVPEDRWSDFVRHLREPQEFNRPHRVPSISADSAGYEHPTGRYWCGGVWSPTNYMVLKGLRRTREVRLAHQIALNHLQNVAEVFQHTDTFWENYAPESAAPGQPAQPHFVGWTGLSAISILLEDVIGISVDWPLRRVTWDRRMEQAGRYGVRNLPLGADGKLHLLGDERTIEITTTVPFSLTVRQQEATMQTAVPAGSTTLQVE